MNDFKRMRRLSRFAASAAVTALALWWATTGTALAQSTDLWTTDFQKAFMTEPMMHKMDMSGKGMVTRSDYDRYMSDLFDKMDRKRSGMLDKKDFTTMDNGSTNIWTTDFQKHFRTVAMMHKMGMSDHGMVSKSDFMHHMDMIFDSLDKDHNGMLEKDEFVYERVFGSRR